MSVCNFVHPLAFVPKRPPRIMPSTTQPFLMLFPFAEEKKLKYPFSAVCELPPVWYTNPLPPFSPPCHPFVPIFFRFYGFSNPTLWKYLNLHFLFFFLDLPLYFSESQGSLGVPPKRYIFVTAPSALLRFKTATAALQKAIFLRKNFLPLSAIVRFTSSPLFLCNNFSQPIPRCWLQLLPSCSLAQCPPFIIMEKEQVNLLPTIFALKLSPHFHTPLRTLPTFSFNPLRSLEFRPIIRSPPIAVFTGQLSVHLTDVLFTKLAWYIVAPSPLLPFFHSPTLNLALYRFVSSGRPLFASWACNWMVPFLPPPFVS